ncbi:3-deoxy-manno-octulosonate cytidylyltransferase [Halomicrobium sp. IBSBa]|uniref:3-deoxy-manno-octulosonate cytidylyltransferase n=1 Tax=Halomicrobium sp. IBSBa TaxID=2778916 RepID=UPI001AC00917|nr:3-deoxy-manno-octulosonate cytidylyltransferase [Halomicrobium sp. IBSBa]MBO4247101.1 3-deoxy-manno-octulosonate cytidylyltransferase [Halomicrobium sp. IBSBa]
MVELVISDVDGVLTEGSIQIGPDGELFKTFDVKDGQGITSWLDDGGDFVIITGRESQIVEYRAAELGIEEVYQSVSDKLSKVENVANQKEVSLDNIAYIGDDISDLELLKAVGISCCPADAAPEVRDVCDYISGRNGGDRAVRDILDYLRYRKQSVLGVIPARYGSTRLPGKPLVDLAGKPMIQHVYERASQAELLDGIVVATDDKRILEAVEDIGGTAVMTDSDHSTGTDRVAAVAGEHGLDVTVNIQGDEPLIDPAIIDATIEALLNSTVGVATPISTIKDESLLNDENTVKVVRQTDGKALYFSRSLIPSKGNVGKTHKHIGLYAFKTDLLLEYVDMDSTLEAQEDLEQLRLLEHGYDIQTIQVDYDPKEVNVEADIERVERILEQ